MQYILLWVRLWIDTSVNWIDNKILFFNVVSFVTCSYNLFFNSLLYNICVCMCVRVKFKTENDSLRSWRTSSTSYQ